jgi:tripartite-type tricarboxylate transporter receptor subunit TctC
MPNDAVIDDGNNAAGDTHARRPVAAFACAIALKLIVLGLIAFAATDAARAETYPSRNIDLVVPLAAGSTTDVAARVLSDQVSKTLGQTVVVENKPGAGIMVGSS